ncbi:DsrE/DsrF/DrsH-like family protein [Caldicellulosiruptoraceae bacterium PP1]
MREDKKTIIVFSNDLDKVMASLVIATGAAAMGDEVTMFFTFWGLNVLRDAKKKAGGKSFLEKMFGMMMPKGVDKLPLSKLNFLGIGPRLMKYMMKKKNVNSLPQMLKEAQELGVKFIACSMSMDVMGIKKEELIDGVEIGGVATYLGEASEAGVNLFI